MRLLLKTLIYVLDIPRAIFFVLAMCALIPMSFAEDGQGALYERLSLLEMEEE